MNISSLHFDEANTEQLFQPRAAGASYTAPGARRRPDNRRRRRAPQQFNGIHRRRRKKIRW